MSKNINYKSSALVAFINNGAIRLPLSHTRALEVIAHLEGATDWNVVANGPDSALLKSRASVLRDGVNGRLVNGKIFPDAADLCISEILQIIAPAKGLSSKKMPFTWSQEGTSKIIEVSGVAITVHDNFLEVGTARFLRIAGNVVIAVPLAAIPSKEKIDVYFRDYDRALNDNEMGLKICLHLDLIVVPGAPNAIDKYSPLSMPRLTIDRVNLAVQLLEDFTYYCGAVKSEIYLTLGFLAAAIESLPTNFARNVMDLFLTKFNEFEKTKGAMERQLNFTMVPANREVAARLARLAVKLGMAEKSAVLANYEIVPEGLRELLVKNKLA